MTEHLIFIILGLGSGAVYAALGTSLVVTYRSSKVVNFSTGAIALYAAYTFAYLRKGEFLIPIPGFPISVHLGSPLNVASSMVIAVLAAVVVGLLIYVAVFRPLRAASPVALAVASIGVMLVLQSVLALRVGTNPIGVDAILSQQVVLVDGVRIPLDRLYLAGIVVVLALLLGGLIRFTRFGLATRAVAESERGALLSGLSPERIAAVNWALSAAVAAVSGILIAPIVPLVPLSYTLFIVPALAAALAGGLTRLAPTVVVGLVIGMVQSDLTYLQTVVHWLPASGNGQLVTLLLILVLLTLRRDRLPQRGSVSAHTLGRAPSPRTLSLPVATGAILGLVGLTFTHGGYRGAVITTLVLIVLGLSQVVVTGLAGQVSLAQLSLAGVGAFTLSRLSVDLGIPFPIAPLLAALVAAVVGVVVGLPALRLRGLPVAVVTLAMSVTFDSLWFQNAELNGGVSGAPIAEPTLFGWHVGIGGGEDYPRIWFGIICLATVLLVGVGVALLRRSRLGASMLAVRANERSAAASGINVARTKLIAFAIGAFIAGLGGSLMAYQQTVASPGSYTALAGIALFAGVYLTGVNSIGGGVLSGVIGAGGILYVVLNRWLELGDYFGLITGVLLVLTVITNPEGIVGPINTILARRRAARRVVQESDLVEPDVDLSIPVPGDPVLRAAGIGVTYGGVTALQDVSFDVRQGEILGLIGPNGAGKTTLIDALSGFARPTGSVSLRQDPLDGLSPYARSRRGLGRTFQGVELYDDLTVRENVTVGTNAVGARAAVELDDLFGTLRLTPFAERSVSELSQGQRQLVSIARALAGAPEVLLLDEPAAGLDSGESRWLGRRLREVRAGGTTIVMVDHDMGLVLELCDRIVVLDLGRVIADGTPDEIKRNPAVVRAYLGTSAPDPGDLVGEPALGPIESADESATMEVRP